MDHKSNFFRKKGMEISGGEGVRINHPVWYREALHLISRFAVGLYMCIYISTFKESVLSLCPLCLPVSSAFHMWWH